MDYLRAFLRPGGRPRSVEDGMSGSTLQPQPTTARRPTLVPSDDRLATYRHLVGIHSAKSFAPVTGKADLTHNNLQFEGRAAPNLGIYNRVVHREQEAKRGYKFASILINGCLGVQIVVAAALTAMGAANSGHVGITAFGAINTVIAGLLTYLKGSGLPNRLRYYENEWKKVREYIEQRERDFSRTDCPLDVYEIVRVIEAMYEDVKADIQTNTPDSFVSIGDIRKRGSVTNPQIPTAQELLPHPRSFHELEMKYGHRVADFLGGLGHKEEDRLKQMEVELEKAAESKAQEAGRIFHKDFEVGKKRAVDAKKELRDDLEASVAGAVNSSRDALEEAENDISRATSNLGRKVEDALSWHGPSPTKKD